MSEQKLIRVQFKRIGKTYYFSAPEDMELQVGEFVIVNTARGKQIAKVASIEQHPPDHDQEVQGVERKATPRDLILRDMIKEKEAEALEKARDFLNKPEYKGVKAIDAEYSFDSTRLTLFLTYEDLPNFNMRNFIREAAPMYTDTRLEIRQVGPRDMAKEVSGLGACGIEKRCCSRFLTEFSSISIRMAKSQNVSLTPTEITGICGRLRCCLAYEHDMYEEARKLLPKRKKSIQTPLGEGKVIQVLPLSDSVIVSIPEVGSREITRTELETGVMEEKKPVLAAIQSEDTSDDHDVEMVRFDQIGRPPKGEESRPGSTSKTRQRRDRSMQTRTETFEEQSGQDPKIAQPKSSKDSASSRKKRGRRPGKRVSHDGSKSK
ncbi:MAG: stage 0 sporulation protein [Chloroflexi bacterium]|nr:stage 0 sporulation protein [Chloroflexota bacterium]